jgi:hypothetical protein
MRRTVLLGSVLLPVALVAAGCASDVSRADGPGGPITPPPPTVASATPSAPPSAPPSHSPSSTPSKSHTPSADPTPTILGHTGFGALKLGMTSRQARATGLIAPWTGHAEAGCSLRSHLKGGHGEGAGDDGIVLLSGDTGVEVIDAYPGVSTPEGIHIGSTKAQMLKAYPDWTNAELPDAHADGRGGADVPGNSKAFYRIETRDGKVVELTLQLRKQNCYE